MVSLLGVYFGMVWKSLAKSGGENYRPVFIVLHHGSGLFPEASWSWCQGIISLPSIISQVGPGSIGVSTWYCILGTCGLSSILGPRRNLQWYLRIMMGLG
ncbi:hypothetical protein F4824DRAFT_439305 [Ustulina deusta]|nr:hypothetical protein F4824DRAFT_439305 [Ustulina deusta]